MKLRKRGPVVLNRLQLRLAIELAAQAAAREELRRQIAVQLPGESIRVTGCVIDIELKEYPAIEVCGRTALWEA